jgi:hypothetical protein
MAFFRRPLVVALVLACGHFLLALLALQPAPFDGGDNAVYLTLARSLLADGSYRDLFDPAAPTHVQFPPGYPIIVAGALALGVKPWIGLKVLGAVFSAIAVALTYLWCRRRAGATLAMGVAAIVAVLPGVLTHAHQELSDVPFWACSMAALLAWERRAATSLPRSAAGSLAVACAYLVRSAALPLLLASTVWLVVRRRWSMLALHAAIVLPPVVTWWRFGRAQGGYASFLMRVDPYAPALGRVDAAGLLVRAWDNVARYATRLLPEMLTGVASAVGIALALALVGLALAAWWRRLRRAGVAELMLPLYVAMLLAWSPAWAGTRLVLPVLPILLLYAAETLTRARRLANRAWGPYVPAVAAVLLLLMAAPASVRTMRAGVSCQRAYRAGDRVACLSSGMRDFHAAAERMREALPAGATVLSRKPALLYASSGIAGRTYPFARSADSLLAAAREAGARYVLLDRVDAISEVYLTPAILRRPGAFCVMLATGTAGTALFGIVPGAEAMPDQRADPGAAEVGQRFTTCSAEYWRDERARARATMPSPT